MPELSLNDIDRICRDVKREQITFSHLLDDLIDHICCDVEKEMSTGLSFADAYRTVKKKIGYGRLKEIQQETLFAVDKKYRFMKTTMKISGITGTVLFGFAALFKIQHWPLAGLMLTLGAFILAFIFMPSALGVLWKETKSGNRLVLFISVFLSAMFLIFGVLFKVQHWPGAGLVLLLAIAISFLAFAPSLLVWLFADPEKKKKRPVYIAGLAGLICFMAGMFFKIQHWPVAGILMITGLLLISVVALPWYTWLRWKEESHIDARFLYLIIGALLIVLPASLVNLNLQYAYDNGFYPHQDQQKAMFSWLYNGNSKYLSQYRDSACYEKMNQLHQRSMELTNYISSLQAEMVRMSEGKPGNPAVSPEQVVDSGTGTEIIYRKLSNPFDRMPVNEILGANAGKRKNLEALVKEYSDFVEGLVLKSADNNASDLLSPASFLPDTANNAFDGSLMSYLHSMEVLKNAVMGLEAGILRELSSENTNK